MAFYGEMELTARSRKSNYDLLSEEQKRAFEILQSGDNVFLTGGAGSGKSFLVREFMRGIDTKDFPILASTGAAAVLVGGRTFHSFFGLGILEGGADAAFEKGRRDLRVMKRLARVEGVIIDEISMIPAAALEVAERLAREARQSGLPWGGLRVIVVGDFAQLPPVSRGAQREWCFLSSTWQASGFQKVLLSHNQRVHDDAFLDILSDVRLGRVTERVVKFLNSRIRVHDDRDESTRLFPRRAQAETYNSRRLQMLNEKEEIIDSIYIGLEKHVEILKKTSPIAERLVLKRGARVMFIQNDSQGRWVNGTQGTIVDIQLDKIIVEKDRGRDVTVEKAQFSLQDAEGEVVASVLNFPLTLAYATTIHKSQGSTLRSLWVDLSQLWEPGQAYVALSRLQEGEGLYLLRWNPRSVIADTDVLDFYDYD